MVSEACSVVSEKALLACSVSVFLHIFTNFHTILNLELNLTLTMLAIALSYIQGEISYNQEPLTQELVAVK